MDAIELEYAASERALLRVQAASGALFLGFTLLHLANTATASFGHAAYDGYLAGARVVYRQPVVEVLGLLAPLAVHWGAAIVRLRRSGFRRRNRTLRARLHRYTGWFLLVFVWGHVAATRAPGVFAGVDLDAAGLAWTFDWMPSWFYPYYTALALAGLYHGLNGGLVALSVFGVRVPSGLRRGPGFWVPLGVGALALIVGIAGLSGLLFPIGDPSASAYARFIADLMTRRVGAGG